MDNTNSIIRFLDPKKVVKPTSVASWVMGGTNPGEIAQATVEKNISQLVAENMHPDDTHVIVITVTTNTGEVLKNFVKCCQEHVMEKFVTNFHGMGFVDSFVNQKQPTAAAA